MAEHLTAVANAGELAAFLLTQPADRKIVLGTAS